MQWPFACGTRYGPYVIEDLVGEGSFAGVYLARAPGFDAPIALKVSRLPLHRSTEAQRFFREVAILRTLTSPHVVRIHDSGYGDDGRVLIAMEYLEGLPLDRFHAWGTPMPPAQALALIHGACLGVADAHAHGIVHRDIKPGNLWVEPDHNVKVIDFGLARAWDVASTIGENVTVGHMLIGTPHYMQPEQIMMQKLPPSSDVYSLAMILYELLSGRSPFFPDMPLGTAVEAMADDPVKWIEAHARRPVIPLHAHLVARDLPAELVELVQRCLDKDPANRPPDAGALSVELGTILHYDYGAIAAATLRLIHPYGGWEDLLLLPGIHLVGSDPSCRIRLRHAEIRPVHAVLEWSGLPDYPTVRSMADDGSVRLGGAAVSGRVQLGRDDRFSVGPFILSLQYPDL